MRTNFLNTQKKNVSKQESMPLTVYANAFYTITATVEYFLFFHFGLSLER